MSSQKAPMRHATSIITPVAHLVGPGRLKVVNGRLAFSTGEQTAMRLDPQALRTVLCYGPVGVSGEAFALLFRHDVQVAWMSPGGHKFRGRLVRSDPATTALRVLQHAALLDGAFKLETARHWVERKIDSQAEAARHYQRQGHPGATTALHQLRDGAARCGSARTLNELRGMEGTATAAWFALLGELLRRPWRFQRRVRRPPTDPVNSLLSFGYTLLVARTVARCEAMGLEPTLGALHEPHPGRPSLACDLVEPLRVPAVDRWVVTLCNEGRLAPGDFRSQGAAVLLQPAALPRVIASWEQHWTEAGNERLLGQAVDWVVAAFRRREPTPPTPAPAMENGGTSGGT